MYFIEFQELFLTEKNQNNFRKPDIDKHQKKKNKARKVKVKE